MPTTDTFDWESLARLYLSGIKLKSLSFEATGNPLRPKFSTLRTYASRHGWKQKRCDFWKTKNDINNFLLEKITSGLTGESEQTINTIDVSSTVVSLTSEQPQTAPSQHFDPHEEVSRFKREVAEFTRSRIEAESVRRLEREKHRPFDSFGRRISRE